MLPPLPQDPLDPLDPGESSETFIFEHPSITLSHLACKAPLRIGSRTLRRHCGPLGQLWEVLEELWEAPGGMFETKMLFLRKIKAPAGTLNTKTEFLRKTKAPAGTLNTKTEFLRKIKAPAGALNTKTEFMRKIKAPAGTAGMYKAYLLSEARLIYI